MLRVHGHGSKIRKCLIWKLYNLQSYRSSPRLTGDMLKNNLKKKLYSGELLKQNNKTINVYPKKY